MQNITISKACTKLSTIKASGNKLLGTKGFTIGSFKYTPTRNGVYINNMWDCDDLGGGNILGHRIEYWQTIDWYKKWLPSLTYLDMAGCNIKYYGNDSWGKKGGCNSEFYVRFGSNVVPESSNRIGRYKKYKASGFCSCSSRGEFWFDGTLIYYCGVDGSAKGYDITYTGGVVRAEDGAVSVNLNNHLATLKVYDDWTQAYAHDWAFVIFPFGS